MSSERPVNETDRRDVPLQLLEGWGKADKTLNEEKTGYEKCMGKQSRGVKGAGVIILNEAARLVFVNI